MRALLYTATCWKPSVKGTARPHTRPCVRVARCAQRDSMPRIDLSTGCVESTVRLDLGLALSMDGHVDVVVDVVVDMMVSVRPSGARRTPAVGMPLLTPPPPPRQLASRGRRTAHGGWRSPRAAA